MSSLVALEPQISIDLVTGPWIIWCNWCLLLSLSQCNVAFLFMSPFSHVSVLFSCKGKLSDMKSTWSQGPISQSQASLSHELWKVPQGPRSTTAPSRPPPGLTNSKPSSTWSGNSLGLAPGWNGSYSSGEYADLDNETYIRETPTLLQTCAFFLTVSHSRI